jgi:FtsP/CotA-like multicopper oxidase with cupredoxin domain
MQDTTYTFVAHNAGTYLYHCHVADVVHVQMGMYGLIVVKAAGGAKNAWTGGPPYSKDYKWLLTEVDRSWHDTIPVHNPNTDTLNVPPYRPDYFLVNGKSGWELNADDSIKISGSQNEPIYLRLGNIMYFYNRVIIPPQLNAQIISSDGRPLPNAIISDTVEIMPGERYGVMLQASVQFNDSIAIQYIDMNTDSVWNTQYVQVNISGIYSVPEIKKPASISVFPNPSNDFITIKFTDKKTVNGLFSIVNILGENVVSGKLTTTDGKKTINISHLPSGTYFLNVQEENFSFPAARFIKID